jgi:hypothetical protein
MPPGRGRKWRTKMRALSLVGFSDQVWGEINRVMQIARRSG